MIYLVEIITFAIMIIFFALLGSSINQYIFNDKRISLCLGFLSYASIFHILAFFPMINTASYEWVIFFVTPICMLISLKIIFTKPFKKENIKVDIKFILYSVCALFISLINSIYPVTVGDQWLYAPMTLSSSYTGTIYYNTQILLTHATHYADSSYLLYNTILNILPGNNSIEFILVLQLFLALIIFSSFRLISGILFKENLYLASYIQVISFSIFIPIFSSWNLVQIGFRFLNGTFLFLIISIPLLLIFNLFFEKIKNPTLYLFILTLSAFSFTSSALMIFTIGLLGSLFYTFFFEEKHTAIEKFRAVMNVSIIIAVEVWTYTVNLALPTKYSYVVLFIIIIFYAIYICKVKGIQYAYAKNVIYAFTGIYLILEIICFIYFNLVVDGSKNSYELYPNIFDNLIITVVFIISLVYFYKSKQTKFLKYYFTAILFFANPFTARSIGNLIGEEGFYRIYYLCGRQFILMVFVVILLKKLLSIPFSNKKIIQINIIVVLIIMNIYGLLAIPFEKKIFRDFKESDSNQTLVQKISVNPGMEKVLDGKFPPKTCVLLNGDEYIQGKIEYPIYYRPEINIIRSNRFHPYVENNYKNLCTTYYGVTSSGKNDPQWVVDYGTYVYSIPHYDIYKFDSHNIDEVINNGLLLHEWD